MPTIEYDRTLDDVINFNMYHIKNSPTLRRQILLGRVVASLIVGVGVLALTYMMDIDKHLELSAYGIAFVGAVFFFAIFPWVNTYGIRRRTIKLLKEGKNSGLMGRQWMTIQPEYLLCEGVSGESKVYWNAVERVAINDAYVLLYLSAVNAIAIPKRAFANSQDLAAFLATLQHYVPHGTMAV